MAGIGFSIRRLPRRENLVSPIQAFSYAAIIATGPWVFTVLSLVGVSVLAPQLTDIGEISAFRAVITYNFAFSLVLTSPTAILCTRFIADAIYARDIRQVGAVVLTALAFTFAVSTVIAALFYGVLVTFSSLLLVLAVVNFVTISGIWVLFVFLSALKAFRAISAIFAIGLLISFGASVGFAHSWGSVGLLFGYTVGLLVIVFSLLAKVMVEFPYEATPARVFFDLFRRHRLLAVSGLAYGSAIWVDKWVMWFAPESEVVGGVMRQYPVYDGAMFFSFLTIVPAMALFTVAVETRFFETYHKFYTDIGNNATLQRVRDNHHRVIEAVRGSFRTLVIVQVCLSIVAIALAPQLTQLTGSSPLQIGIFRFGVLGALFHVLFLLTTILLAYFDMQSTNIKIFVLFLAMNAVASAISLHLGFRFYGYGYFVATVTAFCAGALALTAALRRLPYLAFLVTNSSVR